MPDWEQTKPHRIYGRRGRRGVGCENSQGALKAFLGAWPETFVCTWSSKHSLICHPDVITVHERRRSANPTMVPTTRVWDLGQATEKQNAGMHARITSVGEGGLLHTGVQRDKYSICSLSGTITRGELRREWGLFPCPPRGHVRSRRPCCFEGLCA
jgi:hypothetical protein